MSEPAHGKRGDSASRPCCCERLKWTPETRKRISFLRRCRDLAKASSVQWSMTNKTQMRSRRLIRLGRPRKAPSLRESLFQWFCSVRGSVKGRVPLKCLRFEALRLRKQYVLAAARRLRHADVPIINHKWLQRFRKEYGISLRLPNKRWKVSRGVFLGRLRITWLYAIRMRYWVWLATGELPESIDNAD